MDNSHSLPSVSRLRLEGPQDLAVAIPHLLGFHPNQSLVLVGIDCAGRVVVTSRCDLPEPDMPLGGIDWFVRHCCSQLLLSEAAEVVAAVYSSGPLRASSAMVIARAVQRVAGALPLDCRDVLHVVGDGEGPLRVVSLLCPDASCCPAEGRAVDPLRDGLHLSAEFVGRGRAPLASREEVTAALHERNEVTSGLLIVACSHAVDGLDAAARSPLSLETWRDDEIENATEVLLRGEGIPPDSCGRLIVALNDIRVRDTLLHRLLAQIGADADRWEDLARRLVKIVADAPQGMRAPIATLCSLSCWLAGNGLLASACLELALAEDCDYSMAKLIRAALGNGMPPSSWGEAMSGLTEYECRYGTPPAASGRSGRRAQGRARRAS